MTMDAYKATHTLMSRIRSIDPENASRISGYVLMNADEEELIRLALGPDALLLSYVNQAKVYLSGLGSSKPLNPNPGRPLQETSPRIVIPNNGFHLSSPFPPPAAASPRPNSYASVLNAGKNVDGLDSSFYGTSELFSSSSSQNQDQSPSERSDSLFFDVGNAISSPHPHSHGNQLHRRSFSVNDAVGFEDGDDEGGFGGRPCMYFARGFCKKGSSCKFIHSEMGGDVTGGGGTMELGSPSSGFDELLKLRALQQQRAALMASGGHHSFSFNQRNIDLSPTGMGAGSNSSARQIYLTFPSDSTFKEEDVSSYFSTFGPVQDVRIPYQQKRMFGFVTFVYPETVKLILEKRNPHFVCDSRVLVKPYKEKGKIPDKKQFQQHLSQSRIDSREVFSVPVGPRVLLNNTQEIMLRRKLEQEAELQQAIERRMMNLQLMDLNNLQHNNRRFLSPRQASLLMSQNLNAASDAINLENYQEFDTGQETSTTYTISGNNNYQRLNDNDSYTLESLGLILPDSHGASPTKLAVENQSFSLQSSAEANNSTIPVTSTSSNKQFS